MKLTRRQLVCGACSFAGAVLLGESAHGSAHRKRQRRHAAIALRSADARPPSGAQLYEDVIAYYNLGEHRTATEADLRTSQWLMEQLRAAGLKATLQSFSLRQFFIRQTRLTIGDKPVRVVPLWFPRSTGPDPINGTLSLFENSGVPGLRGKLVLAKFPAEAGTIAASDSIRSEIILAAGRSGASAVVAVTEGATKEIVAANTLAGAEPWPIPVVLVGPRDEPMLIAAAKSGAKTSLLLDGDDRRDAKAKNVIASVDRGKDLIVVSTPQSGWFRCAGERGPGVALFLGLARWASRRPSGASFLFVSTSGHELGGLGMSAFLKELAPAPNRVLCWIHLGAGIATYSWEETPNGLKRLDQPDSRRLLMTSPDLVSVLKTSFDGLPGLVPTTSHAVGEFELTLRSGYRTFGIAAGHRFHHTPADSPEMTGPEILEPVGRALISAIDLICAGVKRQ